MQGGNCVAPTLTRSRDTACLSPRLKPGAFRRFSVKIIDTRDCSIKSGKELSCNRTNRRELRNSEKSLRKYRGTVVKHGRRAIRRQRYSVQAGDVVSFKGYTVACHGTMSGGKRILLLNRKESPTGKTITALTKNVKLLYHVSGWKKVALLYPHG